MQDMFNSYNLLDDSLLVLWGFEWILQSIFSGVGGR
jgi:hypothetical protein